MNTNDSPERLSPAAGSQPNYPTLKYPFNRNPMASLLDRHASDEMRKNYIKRMWGEKIAHVMKECPIGATVEGGEVGGYLIEPLNRQLVIKVVDRRQGQLRVLMAYADS